MKSLGLSHDSCLALRNLKQPMLKARERGYLYNYGVEHGPIKSKIRVRLDELGNITSALQTK